MGDFIVAFNVKFVSRPSLRIQTLFALAWTLFQRPAGRYVILSALLVFVAVFFEPSIVLKYVKSSFGNVIVNLEPFP